MSAFTTGRESNWQYLKRMYKWLGIRGFLSGIRYLWEFRRYKL